MHRLIIAEKPSVAAEIAQLLGVTKRFNGYFQCGDDCVSSAFGHLFEMAKPEHYGAIYKDWHFGNMPIVPREWAMLPKEKTKDRIKLLGQLMRDAQVVVNAGDPDNEGQLLVDQIIEHFDFQGRVLRFWANAVDPTTLQAAWSNLRDNRDFVGMRDAARARGCSDWLIGMNGSRAITLQAQAQGHTGVIPVGRVMTPTLAMVVKRDEDYANFRPVPYHYVTVTAQHQAGEFRMRWQPSAEQPGIDEEGRLVDTAVANAVVERFADASALITQYNTEHKREHQPRSLSLAGIGLLASEMFGYSALATLEICQALYETHKLTSYPRTDSEYLKESQHQDAPTILSVVRDNLPQIAPWVDACDPSIKSKTWDDTKTPVHHGIIPTPMRCNIRQLSERELNVYQLIVRAYIAQFYPAHEYDEVTVTATSDGEDFAAKGKVVTEQGWKQLYSAATEEGDDTQALPVMAEQDPIRLIDAVRHDKKTTHPKRFTEGTLPPAMENIYRYIEDPADRKALQDGDGIGTPATRPGIIEDLKKRGFLTTSGKWLVSTEQGRQSLSWIPPELKSPALTAHFQRQLRAIEEGEADAAQFIQAQTEFVAELVARARAATPYQEQLACPECGTGHLRRVGRRDRSGHFWSCSGWRDGCSFTANDADGKPDLEGAATRRASRQA
ncbi:DNA topoisomerase-3 [Variovorax boronicumulans]|uniref:DNA topoisomerase n=1 Tax=Variovorax boronicumulans TaxID=436515 RepID=A0AAW8D3I7_9BURK|nr:DNA topoisomerase 3 [Variovorax boronicumulans]MDP9897339.1 DNA topoisomerase-3 [Variovorax boronicumulans]MDQ0057427.1 DNA topoisomerase-3 [Variovorax boronicumulans]